MLHIRAPPVTHRSPPSYMPARWGSQLRAAAAWEQQATQEPHSKSRLNKHKHKPTTVYSHRLHQLIWHILYIHTGFPGGTSGKEPACQCRRCKQRGFDPWVREILWRRACQPTPVLLPGESPGQRSLAGLQSMGSQRVKHNWSDLAQHIHTYKYTERQRLSSRPEKKEPSIGCRDADQASMKEDIWALTPSVTEQGPRQLSNWFPVGITRMLVSLLLIPHKEIWALRPQRAGGGGRAGGPAGMEGWVLRRSGLTALLATRGHNGVQHLADTLRSHNKDLGGSAGLWPTVEAQPGLKGTCHPGY